MQPKRRTARSWSSMRGNAQGHFLEGYIKGACAFYKDQGRAYVEQIPEPFRVMETYRDGRFTGRFIANAQPDFMGVLPGGGQYVLKQSTPDKRRCSNQLLRKRRLTRWNAGG